MSTTLTIDLFISADGWAGSQDLPGYFGYLGPELQAWIAEESAAPQVTLMGRKTYQLLSGLPDDAKDEGHRAIDPARDGGLFPNPVDCGVAQRAASAATTSSGRRGASSKSQACRCGPWAASQSASNSSAMVSSIGCA